MQPLHIVQGRAIPLDRADVDTDQIIPARHLKRIGRTGLGQFAFEAWRNDPGFVLNDDAYRGAPIMLAGANFGCGSSREHAPWALQDMGIKVMIAPSFADIFRNNCARVGLLTVALGAEDCKALSARVRSQPTSELRVDLPRQVVQSGDGEFERDFDVDPFVKHCLINGLDTIGITLEHVEAIAKFEERRPAFMPTTVAGREPRR